MKPVLDTNILIDYLAGIPEAVSELRRFSGAFISVITWTEVMTGARHEGEERVLRRFLLDFEQVPVDQQVADIGYRIRRQHRVKLPDAIIWATARARNTLLVTRNSKDFSASEPDIRIPYQL